MEFSKLKVDGATAVPLNSRVDADQRILRHRPGNIFTIRFVETVSPGTFIQEFLWRGAQQCRDMGKMVKFIVFLDLQRINLFEQLFAFK